MLNHFREFSFTFSNCSIHRYMYFKITQVFSKNSPPSSCYRIRILITDLFSIHWCDPGENKTKQIYNPRVFIIHITMKVRLSLLRILLGQTISKGSSMSKTYIIALSHITEVNEHCKLLIYILKNACNNVQSNLNVFCQVAKFCVCVCVCACMGMLLLKRKCIMNTQQLGCKPLQMAYEYILTRNFI